MVGRQHKPLNLLYDMAKFPIYLISDFFISLFNFSLTEHRAVLKGAALCLFVASLTAMLRYFLSVEFLITGVVLI